MDPRFAHIFGDWGGVVRDPGLDAQLLLLLLLWLMWIRLQRLWLLLLQLMLLHFVMLLQL